MIARMKNSVSHGANWLFPFQLNLLLSMSVAPTKRQIWLYFPGRWSRSWKPVHISVPTLSAKWASCSRLSRTIQQRNTVTALLINKQASLHRVLHFVSCLLLPAPICCQPYQNTCSALYKPCSLCWVASSSLLHLTSVHPPRPGPVFFKSSLYPVWVGVLYSLPPRYPGILSQSLSFYIVIFALSLPQKTMNIMTTGMPFLFVHSAASRVLDIKCVLLTSTEWRDIYKGQNH